MPTCRRFYIPGHPVFVTIVTHRREPWLASGARAEILLESMRWAKTQYPFRHLAHVILPDHLHWMFLPEDVGRYSKLVGAIKRDTTWRLKDAGLTGPFWQARFYDHVISDEDHFGRHLDYVHFNPVKHGYVTRVADYERSSFAEWVRRDVYPNDWGNMEPEWIRDMNLEWDAGPRR
jgi:putative transposase